MWQKSERDDLALSTFATGAGLSLFGFALTEFDHEGRIICFLAGIIICAAAQRFRPVSALRIGANIFAGLIAYHILVHIRISDHVGTKLFVNELWFLTALPALICGASAWFMSRSKPDLWSEGLKAFALAFTALFAVFQIHHAMNGGDLGAGRFTLEELALQVLVGLSFTLGGSILNLDRVKESGNPQFKILPFLLTGISIFTMAAFALGILFVQNPLFEADNPVKGGAALNTLFLAFLVPAVFLGLIAYWARKSRPQWYLAFAGGLALIGWIMYVTGMIRYGFQGSNIALSNWPQDMEMYVISAAWLLTGIALLAIGIKTRRIDLRAASAAIIVLTVLKAFLVDMASLEGVLRALSFVILGIVLIAIGRVYQRILFSKSVETEA